MPRPIAAGVFGMARTTLPPHPRLSAVIVMPAMIDTTSVDDVANGRSCGPASRNICGFSATTRAATLPIFADAGLSCAPFAAIALISSDGYGSITTTFDASSPRASQPDNNAPPILPAPASTILPCRADSGVAGDDIITKPSTSSPRRRGPITTGFCSETPSARQAALHTRVVLWVPASAGTTPDYASPSVSNIAALIASAADLPAHTANCNAG